MLGKKYLIDHCIGQIKQKSLRKAYETYMSEILRSLNNNVAQAWGGTKIDKSFEDAINYKPETRSGEEVKAHVLGVLKKL